MGAFRSSSSSSAVDRRAEVGSGSSIRPARDSSSWTRPTPKPMAARGCPPRLIAEVGQCRPPWPRGQPPAGGDHGQRQAAPPRLREAGQRLHRLARVAGGDDQRPLPGPRRQAVVAMHDQRHAQPVAGRRGHQLRADRRAAHGEDADGVDVGVRVGQLDRRRHPARLDELAAAAPAHGRACRRGRSACSVRRVVEGDRLLEQRRPVASSSAASAGRGAPGSSSGCL